MRFETTADVHADQATVWSVMRDVENYPQITASMTSVTLEEPDGLRLGSRVTVVQPRLPKTVWTVTTLVEPSEFAWESDVPGMRTRAEHRVTPLTDGARVRLSIRMTGPAAFLVGLLYGRLTRRYMAMEAEGIKQRAEAAA